MALFLLCNLTLSRTNRINPLLPEQNHLKSRLNHSNNFLSQLLTNRTLLMQTVYISSRLLALQYPNKKYENILIKSTPFFHLSTVPLSSRNYNDNSNELFQRFCQVTWTGLRAEIIWELWKWFVYTSTNVAFHNLHWLWSFSHFHSSLPHPAAACGDSPALNTQ